MTNKDQQERDKARAQRAAEQAAARKAEIEKAPYVALSVQASGIHPSTSRLITIDAVTFTEQGEEVDHFFAVLNPESNPGPFHLHGLSPEQIKEGKRYSQILKALDRLIDGRTLLVHNAELVWGFIVSESKRAMSNAARANRSRNRQRNRRRQRVGHIPKPVTIVDTLATARRLGLTFADIRIRNVATQLGLEAPDARASVARAQADTTQLTREDTLLVARMFFVEHAQGVVASTSPEDLRADRFGLQRSNIRVDATEVPRVWENPGIYTKERGLVQGMEVVVAPEITMDPDRIIQAIVRTDLAYNEKITRASSLVVCNKSEDLTGKAMHGDRKGIPLMTDEEFLRAVEHVKPGKPAET